MIKKIFILVLLPAILLFACTQVSPSGEESGGEVSVADTISNLPDMKVDLPSSLSGVTSGSTSPRTILTTDNVDGVRSEGWKELRQKFNEDNPLFSGDTALLFLDELKQFADETIALGESLETDRVYHLGTRNLLDQYPALEVYDLDEMFTIDLGSFYITEEDNHTRIYWSVQWPTYNELGELMGTQLMRFYFIIDTSATEDRVTFLMTSPPENPTMQYYSYYDGNQGILETYNENAYGEDRMKAFFTNENLKLYEYYIDQDDENTWIDKRIAYGNDEMGGLVSLSETQYLESTESWASSEYFDGEGNLVLEQWGQDNELPYWTEWAENDGENIKGFNGMGATAPERIWIRKTQPFSGEPIWEYTTATDYTGASWTSFTTYKSYLYSLYWKENAEWAEGDSNYWYSESVYESDNDNSYSYKLFEKGDQIPAASTLMGQDFTLSKTYPLYSLLPLSAAYVNDYDLVSDEGTTDSFEWYDENGELHTYNWTYYDFYLVSKASAGIIDKDRDLLISGLNEQTYYDWDYATGEISETKAYVFSTCSNLPSFFSFNGSSIVSTVDAQLNAEFDGAYSTWKSKDYSTEFSAFPAGSFYSDLED